MLQKNAIELARCDLLLIKTGFSKHRATDLDRYVWKTPGISADAASYIVTKCPNIRAVGLDCVSLEGVRDCSHGFKAHKSLLGKEVFVIEDLKLSQVSNSNLLRVFVSPLFVEGIDSSPVTVLAEVRS